MKLCTFFLKTLFLKDVQTFHYFVKMVRLSFKPISSNRCAKLLEKTRDTKVTHDLAAMSIYYIWHPDCHPSGRLNKGQKKMCGCSKVVLQPDFFSWKCFFLCPNMLCDLYSPEEAAIFTQPELRCCTSKSFEIIMKVNQELANDLKTHQKCLEWPKLQVQNHMLYAKNV